MPYSLSYWASYSFASNKFQSQSGGPVTLTNWACEQGQGHCNREKGWDDSKGLCQTISIQWSVISARGNKLYRGVRISSGVPDYHHYVLFSLQLSGMHQARTLCPCPILSASSSSAMRCLLPSSYSPTSWSSSPYEGHGRQYSNTCRHRPRQQMHTSSLWRWEDKTSETHQADGWPSGNVGPCLSVSRLS